MPIHNPEAVSSSGCNPNAILRARPVAPPPELRPFFEQYAQIILKQALGSLEYAGAVPPSDLSSTLPAPSPCDTVSGIHAVVSHAAASRGARSVPAVPPALAVTAPQPSQRLPRPGQRRRLLSRQRLRLANQTRRS